jgi:hypothetical protein
MGTPVAATSFLKHQTGRVFTTYWWGDYTIYEGIPVFVDGRTDMYFGTGILETYVDVANTVIDPGPVFRRWDIRWVKLRRSASACTRTPTGESAIAPATPSSSNTSARGDPRQWPW